MTARHIHIRIPRPIWLLITHAVDAFSDWLDRIDARRSDVD